MKTFLKAIRSQKFYYKIPWATLLIIASVISKNKVKLFLHQNLGSRNKIYWQQLKLITEKKIIIYLFAIYLFKEEYGPLLEHIWMSFTKFEWNWSSGSDESEKFNVCNNGDTNYILLTNLYKTRNVYKT